VYKRQLKGDEKIKIGEKIQVYIERINKKTRRLSLVLPPTKKPVLYR
jgi:transcription antitermination factor NusA-like protein